MFVYVFAVHTTFYVLFESFLHQQFSWATHLTPCNAYSVAEFMIFSHVDVSMRVHESIKTRFSIPQHPASCLRMLLCFLCDVLWSLESIEHGALTG